LHLGHFHTLKKPHGREGEWLVRMRLTEISLWILIFSILILANACASHKTPPRRPSPLVEKKGIYHVVEKHQTLYRICKTYGVNAHEVASVNGIPDTSRINVGQRIFIPGAKKVLKVEVYIDDVVVASGEGERKKESLQIIHFIWPVRGEFANIFEEGESKRHQGIDIRSPVGTPIKAASHGRVIYSGNTIKGYGNLIILRHSEDVVTVYAHNQANLVEEGVQVEQGQTIARVGQTGKASGPHLHFEIRKNNLAVDPLPFLK